MIGLRVGLSVGPRVGIAAGISSNETGPDSAFDFHMASIGISHTGFADAFISGNASTSGGDGALGYGTPFVACRFNQNSAAAPANPMVYAIDTGTEALQPFDTGGHANTGMVQTLGRMLVSYGICQRPALSVFAVFGSSIPTHWLASSNFPASGEKLNARMISRLQARHAEFGRTDVLCIQMSETDAANQTAIDSLRSDYTTLVAQIRTALGLPNLPVMVSIINQNQTGTPAMVENYRQNQIAWVTIDDAHAFGFDGTALPLEAQPHYIMGGYADLAQIALRKLLDQGFFPGKDMDTTSIGGAPRYVGSSAGYTCQASPSTIRARGWFDPRAGDIEVLVVHSVGAAHTVSLTTAAGFTQVAQASSTAGGTRKCTVFTRTIDSTLLNARVSDELDSVKRGACATPVVDIGVATNGYGTIHCVRGSSGVTVTPTTGANNATNTSLSIGGFTTDHNNSLAMICTATSGASALITALTNAAFANITKGREGSTNPGSTTANLSMYWATIPTTGTVVGATSVTFGAASVNAGCIVVFNP